MMTTANEVIIARSRLGWSQRQLTKALGVNEVHYVPEQEILLNPNLTQNP